MADIEDIDEDDHVLFNDRKQPLAVVEAGDEKLLVEGPQGGEYVIYPAPDDPGTLLVARPGNRQYASLVEDLRVVGHWEETGARTWRHTGTGATVQVVETDTGHWTLAVDGIAPPDLPGYGFMEESGAVEAAERFIRRHPEGGRDDN
ncbi:MAG: hypothetical protein SVU88_04955 [Candidatus Nanohaloarchaea archaeon]|nr:hypothetical protein [Candidatus Nanohaloarchaea archaeon]